MTLKFNCKARNKVMYSDISGRPSNTSEISRILHFKCLLKSYFIRQRLQDPDSDSRSLKKMPSPGFYNADYWARCPNPTSAARTQLKLWTSNRTLENISDFFCLDKIRSILHMFLHRKDCHLMGLVKTAVLIFLPLMETWVWLTGYELVPVIFSRSGTCLVYIQV